MFLMAQRKAWIGVRLSEDEDRALKNGTKERGYTSRGALIRAAIRNELGGRDGQGTEVEAHLAATQERLSNDLRRLARHQQALFALVDAFVKTFLTCVPDPPKDSKAQSIAQGRDRYERLLKAAGRAMVGDSQAALNDLIGRAE
jgi:Arc/MetJ-type ribon-helix-helix transcriptional regulator